ncbi:hypothetical protein HDU89_004898 [Geranomyces variabilis]|nr:hypothetical protein HDU89_004898 [Geranomyces variabilis]
MEDNVPLLVTPTRYIHRHRRSSQLGTPHPLAGVTYTLPQPLHSPVRRPSLVREDVEIPTRRNSVPRYDPSLSQAALPEWPPPSHMPNDTAPPARTVIPSSVANSSPRQVPSSASILASFQQLPPSPPPLPPLPRLPTALHPLSASLPPFTTTVPKELPMQQQPPTPKRQTVLIGIDGSIYANDAFDWAAVHLLAKGDNLVVARVLDEAAVRAQYLADQANGTRFLEQELKNHASNLLNHYIPRLQRIAPQTSDVAVTAKMKIGRPQEVLCTLASEIKASRLVIGSRGVTKRTSASSNSFSPSAAGTTSQRSQQQQLHHQGAVARHYNRFNGA